ncbi:hypothetical protein COFR110785_10610 [Corynebacterium frankenforstense]|nr:hypothetical protein [Corynebacterium frankenforstense]
MSSRGLREVSDELAAAVLAGERLPFDLFTGVRLEIDDAAPAAPAASVAAGAGSGAGEGAGASGAEGVDPASGFGEGPRNAAGRLLPEAWQAAYLGAYEGTNPGVRAGFDPPRYCGLCGRRMIVQVRPDGWSARCSRHGELDSAWLER